MSNTNIIKADVQKRLDNLVDFSSRRREWYQGQLLRVVDRQSQQISLISSIAATILAITTVLPIQIVGFWVNLSFLLLSTSVILGIILVLWLVNFDKKVLTQDRNDEIAILDKLKSSCRKVIAKPTELEYLEHVKIFNNQVNKISQLPGKYKLEKQALNSVYYLVLIAFSGGVMSLTLAWFLRNCTLR